MHEITIPKLHYADTKGQIIELIDVEVELEYKPGRPPRISGLPENCDPGDPPEITYLEIVEPEYRRIAIYGAAIDWIMENFRFETDCYKDDGL